MCRLVEAGIKVLPTMTSEKLWASGAGRAANQVTGASRRPAGAGHAKLWLDDREVYSSATTTPHHSASLYVKWVTK